MDDARDGRAVGIDRDGIDRERDVESRPPPGDEQAKHRSVDAIRMRTSKNGFV